MNEWNEPRRDRPSVIVRPVRPSVRPSRARIHSIVARSSFVVARRASFVARRRCVAWTRARAWAVDARTRRTTSHDSSRVPPIHPIPARVATARVVPGKRYLSQKYEYIGIQYLQYVYVRDTTRRSSSSDPEQYQYIAPRQRVPTRMTSHEPSISAYFTSLHRVRESLHA